MMHRIHSGLTVAVAIKAGKADSLRALLKSLANNGNNCLANFKDSETTLFVSGVILPAQNYYGEMLPETFVLATTYCGPLSTHLADLIKTCGGDLCEIFKYCLDFPDGGLVRDEELSYYLKAHRYRSAFNSRYNCIAKQDAEKEKNLRKEIENYLDKAQDLNAFDHLSALQVKTLILRHIKAQGDEYEWAYKPARKNLTEIYLANRGITIGILTFLLLLGFVLYSFQFRGPFLLIFITVFLLLIAVLFAVSILFFIPAYILVALYITRKKNFTASRPPDAYIRKIAATQLHPVLNEMTAAGPLKQGRLRRYFYATALRVISYFASSLMKVPTVSNIRWLVIDNRKRLLFLPNYSNSTDFYVRDFLNGTTPRGVNFMFNNGQGFPDAKLLFKDGITRDPEGYMNAVHSGQHVTDLWYAHEPNLTSDIINKNRKIRNGLFKKMDEKKANEWLKLL